MVLVLSLTVMVANHMYMQPAQPNQEEQDLIAFLRQNVAWRLAWEAYLQQLPKTHPRVIHAVRAYFNLKWPHEPSHVQPSRLVGGARQLKVSSQVTPQ